MTLDGWLWKVVPESLNRAVKSETVESPGFILCLASAAEGTNNDVVSTVHAGCVALIPGYFSGVGDLFSALVLAHYRMPSVEGVSRSQDLSQSNRLPHPASSTANVTASPSASAETQTPLSSAASLALSKTHAMLSFTQAHYMRLPAEERQATDDEADKAEPERVVRRMRTRELRIIQGAGIIRGEHLRRTVEMKRWDAFWQ